MMVLSYEGGLAQEVALELRPHKREGDSHGRSQMTSMPSRRKRIQQFHIGIHNGKLVWLESGQRPGVGQEMRLEMFVLKHISHFRISACGFPNIYFFLIPYQQSHDFISNNNLPR